MKKSLFLLHIAIFIAGLTGIFGKLIETNEVLITFYRMLFAGIAFLVLDVCTKKAKRKYSFRERLKMGSVGLLLGLHWIFFYGSIKYSSISMGVICFCLCGFFTAIFEPLINKKKHSLVEIGLSCLTLVGIGLIFSLDTQFRLGIGLGIISSLLVALYTIFNERLVKDYDTKDLTKIEMIGGAFGIGLLLPAIAVFYPMDHFIPSTHDFMYLLLLSGICTVVLYWILNIALQTISAFTVNLSFNLEPIYSILIAVFFFDEYKELNLNFFVGLSLIIVSLVLQMIRVARRQSRLEKVPN